MISASLLTSLVSKLHALPALWVYVVVGLLVFGEAALFIGFVLPGETTVLVAGVIASQGSVNIVGLCALVVAAAVVGDSVGYLVGREYGERMLALRVFSRHREELDRALAGLQRRGAIYVFLGRFTAFLRAVMPGLAGMSQLHYRRFLIANALGGLVWGTGFTLLGYLGGSQLGLIEKFASYFSSGLLALFALALVVVIVIRRRRRRR
jgi:membrane protein DedA with SNARE-associated domain